MTKHSKCEICRARKIKCDEARPNCGPCERKGRTCVYRHDNDELFVHEQVGSLHPPTNSQTSSASTLRSSSYRSDTTQHAAPARPSGDVALRLKRSRKAETGSGEFLTFGRPRRQYPKVKVEAEAVSEADDEDHSSSHRRRSALSPSPLSIIQRPQESLASRWISIAGAASLDLNPLGSWVKLAWDHVGRSDYLDLAVEYTLTAMTEFRQQKQNNILKISSIGSQAMRALRHAIMSGTKGIDVYVAIMLHYAAEHFRGMQGCYWVTHMSEVSRLLASRQTEPEEQETLNSILHITRDDEIGEAILNGQPSLLEDKVGTTTALGSLELDIAASEIDRLYVKLPRLVLLVRKARQNPYDSSAVGQAVSLAHELHQSRGTLIIQRTLTNIMQRTDVRPTTLASSPVPTSFYFTSIPDFVLVTRYYIFRMLLSGLIQRICDLGPEDNPFFRSEAEAEDVWAGTSIMQCVEWAFENDPLTKLRMLIPVQLGLGVWDRLGQRQLTSDTLEYQQAVAMKAATIDIANQIDIMWGNTLTSSARLWKITEMFAGGPLHEWMYNYRSPTGYAMTQRDREGSGHSG